MVALEHQITVQNTRLEHRIEELVSSVSFQAKETEELTAKVKYLQEESDLKEKKLEAEIDRLSAYIARENLVFLGIPESGERDENTKDILNNFLVEKLKFKEEQVTGIEYQRVHRVQAAHKPRPIKARFLRFADKLAIEKNAKLLKGTKMYIAQDLPKRIRDERKAQAPALKAARNAGKLAYFSRAEPAKLIIAGKWVPRKDQRKLIGTWETQNGAGMNGASLQIHRDQEGLRMEQNGGVQSGKADASKPLIARKLWARNGQGPMED